MKILCQYGNDLFPVSMALPERSKNYAHQRETTVSSNDSLQFYPLSKWELLLKGKNLLPEGANSFL